MKKKSLSRKPRANSNSTIQASRTNTIVRQSKPNSDRSQHDLGNRVMQSVPYPKTNLLEADKAFNDTTGKPNIEALKEHFINEGRLEEDVALKIINQAKIIMRNEPNVIRIDDPITIVGDIHGQFYDLLKLLEIGGDPATSKYLFLGDYVDRGLFSIECILYLYAFKILYPTTFILLRGNHECRHLAECFTFRIECLVKYSLNLYDACADSFDCLPLAAVVNSKFFCVHGGLSPELVKVDDINRINRFKETPQSGLMCDLLWADPAPDFGNETSRSQAAFLHNSVRGCSYHFTYNAVTKFLKTNELISVIRAHEAQALGFHMYKRMHKNFPSLITIFSAPNYLDVYNNKGAIIKYENNLMNTRQYACVPHPYWLPNCLNVFAWSMPFVVEKTTEMFIVILNLFSDEMEPENRQTIIRQKILAISRIARLYSKVREESETIIRLQGITPSTISPINQLIHGIRRSSLPPESTKLLGNSMFKRKLSFEEAKELDKENEQFPKD